MLKYLILSILLSSCAHQTQKVPQIKKDVDEGNISILAVKNLAHSSYLKACTQVSKLSFEACKKLAQKHAEEIVKIIEQ
tara:strand:+ start:4642 stop:4878 length:237 start_codon:yes stop_codon:yes gene_type:complete